MEGERSPGPARVEPLRRSFASRVIGALALDGAVFADVEEDAGSLGQAGGLVLAAGIARGIGQLPGEGTVGLVGSPIVALAAWLSATALVWGIGVRRLASTSSYPELLRTLGFASAPLLLLAVLALPVGPLAPWLWAGAHVWATLALVVAVREALDVTPLRALLVCALALAVSLGVLFVVGALVIEWGAFD